MTSETRYIGKPCAKHPELNGERRKSSHRCVGCVALDRARYKKQPRIREAQLKQRRDRREYEAVERAMREKAETERRIQACALASERFGDMTRWKEVLAEIGKDYTIDFSQGVKT